MVLTITNGYHLCKAEHEFWCTKRVPAGIWCKKDVVMTSMRRHHVASALIRRHFTSCARWDQSTYKFILILKQTLNYRQRDSCVKPVSHQPYHLSTFTYRGKSLQPHEPRTNSQSRKAVATPQTKISTFTFSLRFLATLALLTYDFAYMFSGCGFCQSILEFVV